MDDEQIYQCLDCPDGVQIFASEEELLTHKWDMIRTELSREHMNCHRCGLQHRTFEGLIRHYQLSHPIKQKLVCPGCRETFPRLHLLMGHVETGGCPGITPKAVQERRMEKALVVAAAAERTGKLSEQNIFDVGKVISSGYGQYMGIDVPFPRTRVPDEEDDETQPGSASSTSNAKQKAAVCTVQDFHHGDSKLPDLLTESPSRQRVRDVWSGQDMLGQDSSANTATLPPLFALQPSTANRPVTSLGPAGGSPSVPKPGPSPSTSGPHMPVRGRAGQLSPVDADSGFPDPENAYGLQHDLYRYKNPYTGRFNCPHIVCRRSGKTFKSAGAFRAHMQADGAHTAQRVQCPMCSRYFRSIEALMQHCESQSVRCHLRDSEEYEQFLDTLTGGIVGIEGRHVDLTVSYAVPTDAAKALLPGKAEKTRKTDKEAKADGWVDGIWE